jgi:hypothetical protein
VIAVYPVFDTTPIDGSVPRADYRIGGLAPAKSKYAPTTLSDSCDDLLESIAQRLGRVEIEPTYAPRLGLLVDPRQLSSVGQDGVDTVVFALGFEERAVASAERILQAARPRRVILVRYSDDQGIDIGAEKCGPAFFFRPRPVPSSIK